MALYLRSWGRRRFADQGDPVAAHGGRRTGLSRADRVERGGNTVTPPGFVADVASIDGSASLLVEIAAVLHESRLDRDRGTLARAPHAHREIGEKVDTLARFADDQYGDVVLLAVALSTKLKQTNEDYVAADRKAQDAFDRVLAEGRYVGPGGR
jgi:hypothetical protein